MAERMHLETIAPSNNCVLMFSGGRDSTIAAARLSSKFSSLTLVTLTSNHLVGIQRVKQRLVELKKLLPAATRWLHIRQPAFQMREQLTAPTCLPCQRSYIAVAVSIAGQLETPNIALGYAGYQSSWPEQTSLATQRLENILAERGITLHLPAYEITSKGDVISELELLGLSTQALEQKCLQQINNVMLNEAELNQEIEKWARTIIEQLNSLPKLEIEADCRLEEL